MILALLAVVVFGLFSILLSLQNDLLKKDSLDKKKAEEDRIYKLAVIKGVEEEIAYTTDPEKIVDVIMASLRNIVSYSLASCSIIKDAQVIFKIYAEENVGTEYVRKVEESMKNSFEKLVGKLPSDICRKMHGEPIDDTVKSDYSSSCHMPLIANNKVLALIHLYSTKPNAYSNTQDLHDLIDAASSALTHFSQAIELETGKLSSLIQSIPDGIFMVDKKNNLLTINDSAKKFLGISSDINFSGILDIFGQSFDLADKINKVLLSKKPYSGKEIQINAFALDIFINPAGNDKVSVVLHDATEYKKKELEKDDSIHLMIHELRSPVTTIKDSAELIITSYNDFGKEKKMKFLEIIHQQAKKVLGQIGAILDTAKLDAGKLVLQKTEGDIEKLIKCETQSFMPQAERKNISLSFETLAKSIPKISFDEIRISQVIDNLLSNSLKFTPENGKITVRVEYKAVSPTLDSSSATGEVLSLNKYIVVSVSDNGIGLTPEQQKCLFSKYKQAENSTEKLATMGTGLGLYLIKGIVEAHEGRIWVKSAQGQGATFSFSLPATNTAKAPCVAPKPATAPPATPQTTLSQTVN
jgi:signal transduction histidine kinase